MQNISQQTVNAVRVLSAEAIEKAKSGHPGLPLGAAPVGYALYADVMKYNPKNPSFYDRDRFVLSAGHGSMLLYSLLYLFGFGLKIEGTPEAGTVTIGAGGVPTFVPKAAKAATK